MLHLLLFTLLINNTWMDKVIIEYAPKARLSKKEYSLIKAVALTETRAKQPTKVGKAGEVGIMQVIPYERHIKNLARKLKCFKANKDKTYVLHGVRYAMCRNNKPNIYYYSEKRLTSLVSGRRLKRYLMKSKEASLALGILEMGFWKAKYLSRLKKRFWTRTPYWYAKKRGYDLKSFAYWWYNVKKKLGDNVWIVHYNYGGTLCFGKRCRVYPYRIYKELRK